MSLECLRPGCPLRLVIEAGLSDGLRSIDLSIGHCPLEDSIAEGPHARAANVALSCLLVGMARFDNVTCSKHERCPAVTRVHELQRVR